MSAFGDAVARDILGVFLNADEFAQEVDFCGTRLVASVQQESETPSGQRAVEDADATLFTRTADLPAVPLTAGKNVTVDHRNYIVLSREDAMGVSAFRLRRARGL